MIELVSKKEEIEHLLEEMKNVFSPPLTTRISNLSEYAEKLEKFANVALFVFITMMMIQKLLILLN